MDNQELKLKFSGISSGGIFGGGTTILSRHYKMYIEKNMKTKRYQIKIKENKLYSIVFIFMLFALPLDTFLYVAYYHPTYFINVVKAFGSFVATVFCFIPSVDTSGVSQSIKNIAIPSWVFQIILLVNLFILLLTLYWCCLRGVSKWHGCEHKIIHAAENNDIENARNHPRINDRCGGCFIFTAYAFMAFYWLISYHVLKIEIPIGFLSLTYFVMFLEGKYFHKYNWVGIKIGRLLQEKVTTEEPDEFQIKLGIKGMKRLIKKEQEYARKHPVQVD